MKTFLQHSLLLLFFLIATTLLSALAFAESYDATRRTLPGLEAQWTGVEISLSARTAVEVLHGCRQLVS